MTPELLQGWLQVVTQIGGGGVAMFIAIRKGLNGRYMRRPELASTLSAINQQLAAQTTQLKAQDRVLERIVECQGEHSKRLDAQSRRLDDQVDVCEQIMSDALEPRRSRGRAAGA